LDGPADTEKSTEVWRNIPLLGHVEIPNGGEVVWAEQSDTRNVDARRR
jgi:hypothetical protein